MRSLVDVVAEHLAEWDDDPPHVELAIFGTGDAVAIAGALDALCEAHLGARVAGARFYQSSIGSVVGLRLADGRDVVVKSHQPAVTPAELCALIAVRAALPAAPPVLGGPFPIGAGHAVIEAFVDAGAWGDPHDPAIRRALARGLSEVVEACRPLAAASPLGPTLFHPSRRGDRLWPTPHSKLFDFDATRAGAAWIDDVARAALEVPPDGACALGHSDWRAEHVRFDGGRVAVAYDWDSLARDHEPVLVGTSAHAFTADWTRTGRAQAPTFDEARAFVDDYEAARGRLFERSERRALAATFTYATAYTARCGHARGVDERAVAGTFQHLLASHGTGLLAL